MSNVLWFGSVHPPLCVNLHLRAGRTDGQTEAGNRIWCILALTCDIWWQTFNDFPVNQLTKFRVFIS